MIFFKHLILLIKEVFQFAWEKKVWWIVPIVLLALVVGLTNVPTFETIESLHHNY